LIVARHPREINRFQLTGSKLLSMKPFRFIAQVAFSSAALHGVSSDCGCPRNARTTNTAIATTAAQDDRSGA
jgi:hypothetical protein